ACSARIAESAIELSHCVCSKLLVLGRKVLTIAAYLPATHFERLWIAHIARMKNVRIKSSRGLELLHVLEPGKLEGFLENVRVGRRFTKHRKQVAEMFGRRGAQCFVSDEGEIVALRELVKPIVHGINNGAHAKLFVAQHFAHGLLLELNTCVRVAACQLQEERNETITRISS